MQALACYINGSFVAPGGPKQDYFNPATNASVGSASLGGKNDVDQAIHSARARFDSGDWSYGAPYERAKVLRQIASKIQEHHQQLARLDAIESGKPIKGGVREALGAARVFDYYAGLAVDLHGANIPVGAHAIDITFREPVGVVGQIVPWNFPLLACAWKLAPALAAGCTCVLVTSPLTPSSALALARIIHDCGIPAGVVNILPGSIDASRRLVEHPDCDMISFTGSTEVGSEVMQTAAKTLKRVNLELGGKSPSLIFKDADIKAAAQASVRAAFGNSGQSCSARSRIYVEEAVYQDFLNAFVLEAQSLRMGDPLDEATDIGPLITQQHWERVSQHVQRAIDDGAKAVYGGGRPSGLTQGNYFCPTVLTNVHQAMGIVQQEVFGPVATVSPFAEKDAIALANDSSYGLAASVWTRDLAKALGIARKIKAGNVAINSHPSASELGLYFPFGGYKSSGIGRELGRAGLETYTEVKNIFCKAGYP